MSGTDTSGQVRIFLNGSQSTTTTTGTSISLSTRVGALTAIDTLSSYLTQLNERRAVYGTFLNRLEVASRTLQQTQENYRAAESRIMDADIAAEAASSVRNRVLQQASAAVLAQANLLPQLALKLLE